MQFVDREDDLAHLERFWSSARAQCIPVVGRRRVGKTSLLERFSEGKTSVYFGCSLASSDEQLPRLGAALARHGDDAVLRAEPPTTWEAVFALIERYAAERRFLLVLDELPYWVIKDDVVPSLLQNWWDEKGRHLDLMLVLCGSAVQMMENLLSGAAPLAGCTTGRVPVRPFSYREAALLPSFPEPVDTLTAFGILGGVPLYLSSSTRRLGSATTSRSTSSRPPVACTWSRTRCSQRTTGAPRALQQDDVCALRSRMGSRRARRPRDAGGSSAELRRRWAQPTRQPDEPALAIREA